MFVLETVNNCSSKISEGPLTVELLPEVDGQGLQFKLFNYSNWILCIAYFACMYQFVHGA